MKKLIVFALLSLLTVTVSMADRPVDETRSASSDGTVTIELIAGTVEFVGWNRAEVHITGTVGDDVEELEIDSDGNSVEIEVRLRDGRRLDDVEADLEIHVPVGMEIEVETVSAETTVTDVDGPLDVESVSGDITVTGKVEEISIESISATTEVTSDVPLRKGSIQTVSGEARLTVELASGARLTMETVSGSLELRLPSNTSARFDLSSFSGDIESEFGGEIQESELLPSKSAEFSIGGGDARVTLSAFSGSIELIRE